MVSKRISSALQQKREGKGKLPQLSVREMRKNEQIVRMIERAEKAEQKKLNLVRKRQKHTERQQMLREAAVAAVSANAPPASAQLLVLPASDNGLFGGNKRGKKQQQMREFLVYHKPNVKFTFSDRVLQDCQRQQGTSFIEERRQEIEQKQQQQHMMSVPANASPSINAVLPHDQNIPIEQYQQFESQQNDRDSASSVTQHFYGNAAAPVATVNPFGEYYVIEEEPYYSSQQQFSQEGGPAGFPFQSDDVTSCQQRDNQHQFHELQQCWQTTAHPQSMMANQQCWQQYSEAGQVALPASADAKSLPSTHLTKFHENSRSVLNSSMHEKQAFKFDFKISEDINQMDANITIAPLTKKQSQSTSDESSNGEFSSQTETSRIISFSASASSTSTSQSPVKVQPLSKATNTSSRKKVVDLAQEQRDIMQITKQMMQLGKTWQEAYDQTMICSK